MADILVVEDDETIADHLAMALRKAHLPFRMAGNLENARNMLNLNGAAVILCDYQLPDGVGTTLLTWVREQGPTPFYLMSAFGTVSRAVEGVRAGAADFFEKPLHLPSLLQVLKTEWEASALPESNKAHPRRNKLAALESRPDMLYTPGSPLKDALEMAWLVAHKTCAIYLKGESGTGKEAMARFIHDQGRGPEKPFVAVNCAALSPSLMESELFGYRKGAFTGATEDREGKFLQAGNGTLFLDEVGDMPLGLQTKLLRVLQEKKVTPVGGREEIPVDFRVLCATHKDLRQETALGRFREDLYFRLNVVEIRLPPLRERPLDIPLLIEQFLSDSMGPTQARAIAGSLPPAVLTHAYPGNVRELKNRVERFCVLRELGQGWEQAYGDIAASDTPEWQSRPSFTETHLSAPSGKSIHSLPASASKNSFVSDEEILRALESCGRHRQKTATLLGISRRALQYRLANLRQIKDQKQEKAAFLGGDREVPCE